MHDSVCETIKSKSDMKKGTVRLLVAAAVVLAIFFWIKNSYNGLVTGEEGVKASWSQVENVYQRRADLIPNLVATVKGYASHESETLENVVAARAKATQITIDPEKLDANGIAKFQAAQGELSQAIGRLMMLRESYPELKANQNFLQHQGEISDVENKLAATRRFFNSATKELNNGVQTFPAVLFAGMFGFHREPMFEVPAAERANYDKAPEVKF